jgi:hypothetical protein
VAAEHARKALITRERAFEDSWITYQATVNKLSPYRIAQLAVVAAVRLADGSFDLNAGLGKHIAERTVRWRLSERREQVVEDMINRPLVDMIAEEMQALDEEQAWWARASMSTSTWVIDPEAEGGDLVEVSIPFKDRMTARAQLLRVMESKRKLLGIDRPQQVEVTHELVEHDDPATTKLKAAMEAAKAKMTADLAQVQDEE